MRYSNTIYFNIKEYPKFKFMGWNILLTALIFISGCKKLIEVDLPIDRSTDETIFSNTGTAVAAISGIYADMAKGEQNGLTFTGEYSISLVTGLLSDELTLLEGPVDLYQNNYGRSDPTRFWDEIYGDYLYRINSIIEGLSESNLIPPREKGILLGEAKFLRAFMFFYLVNIYGDVPLVISIDPKENSNIARAPKADVYNQIIKDLKEAQSNLTVDFLNIDLSSGSLERIRPNRAAATALLARVYLYLGLWAEAEQESTKVIEDEHYKLLDDVNAIFLKNSEEAIWQIQPQLSLNFDNLPNTRDGIFLIPLSGGSPKMFLSPQILSAFNNIDDKRQQAWTNRLTVGGTDYYIPYKYKAGPENFEQSEYLMILRLSEQYLIRAEARTQLNKLVGENSAESDLNIIRARADIPNTMETTQDGLLADILLERQRELFTEWGHRWFDLKRTNAVNNVMSVVTPLKGGEWMEYKSLLPLPEEEFRLNKALHGHQNPGYPEPSF